MLLSLVMPRIVDVEAQTRIETLALTVGDRLAPGRKILDVSIDMSASFSQDCPPISHYRLISREAAIVRRLLIVPGQLCAPGDIMAILSTSADESGEGEAARALRMTTAAILGGEDMWSFRNTA